MQNLRYRSAKCLCDLLLKFGSDEIQFLRERGALQPRTSTCNDDGVSRSRTAMVTLGPNVGEETVPCGQGRSQEFANGGQAEGLESATPQRGPAAESRWGSGGEVPRNWRQMCM